jgi:predicted hotdog family 3-hydroxylacyl-ACP dehydratase
VLTAPLHRAEIARLVPHAGRMCLLDRVEACGPDSIECSALSHRDPGHPLRRDGLLPAICGAEYALQAMALHGALTGGDGPQPAGYLASLRGLVLAVERLDDVPGALAVRAVAQAREARSFVYGFEISGGGRLLLSGQAAIILPEAAA